MGSSPRVPPRDVIVEVVELVILRRGRIPTKEEE